MILFPESCTTGYQRSLVKMIIWSPFWEIERPWGHETWLRDFMLIRNCRGLLCWHLQTWLMYLSVPQVLPSGPAMLSPFKYILTSDSFGDFPYFDFFLVERTKTESGKLPTQHKIYSFHYYNQALRHRCMCGQEGQDKNTDRLCGVTWTLFVRNRQCLWKLDRHGTSRVVLDFIYGIASIRTRRWVPWGVEEQRPCLV